MMCRACNQRSEVTQTCNRDESVIRYRRCACGTSKTKEETIRGVIKKKDVTMMEPKKRPRYRIEECIVAAIKVSGTDRQKLSISRTKDVVHIRAAIVKVATDEGHLFAACFRRLGVSVSNGCKTYKKVVSRLEVGFYCSLILDELQKPATGQNKSERPRLLVGSHAKS
jgi:hypothetical protein